MKKKILILLLLVFSFQYIPISADFAFRDVSAVYEYSDAINYLKQNNIVQGYPDGSFRPFLPIARAEFIKILIGSQFKAEEIDNCSQTVFPDVIKNQWYSNYICLAKKKNIVQGYPDGQFKPSQEIQFTEAAKIIVNVFNSNNIAEDPVWYKPYVSYLNNNHAIPPTIYELGHYVTRAEMAEMIYRLKLNIKNKSATSFIDGKYGNIADSSGQVKKHFKMAFILLVKDDSEATQVRKNLIGTIKMNFSNQFLYATNGLAEMDTSKELSVIKINDGMLYANGDFSIEGIAREFYKTNNDIYDFLTIYTSFDGVYGQMYKSVKHKIQGIGLQDQDLSEYFGSNGFLRGVVYLGKIDMFNSDSTWVILHETGHEWCCYVGDPFSRGKNKAQLEITVDGMHYYQGFESPYEYGTNMGSDMYSYNKDGTIVGGFSAGNLEFVERYHPFTLYFMGVLPPDEYSKEYSIYDIGISSDTQPKQPSFYKKISINDIIKVEGERKEGN